MLHQRSQSSSPAARNSQTQLSILSLYLMSRKTIKNLKYLGEKIKNMTKRAVGLEIP